MKQGEELGWLLQRSMGSEEEEGGSKWPGSCQLLPTLPCLSLELEVRGLQACQNLQGGVVDQLEASEQCGE